MTVYLRALALAGIVASATPAFGVISYGTAGSTYTQNFNGLSSTTSTQTFANDSTIEGLFAFHSGATSGATGILRNGPDSPTFTAVDNYLVPSAAATTGSRVYSYGAVDNADRAFGGVTGSTARVTTPTPNNATPGDFYYALVFQNTTGAAIDSYTLQYVGEQYLQAATGTTNTDPQKLEFDYRVVTAAAYSPSIIPTSSSFGSYTAVDALDFTSPQLLAASATRIDGNAAANRVALPTTTVGVTWNPTDYLVLRFFDDDANGNDHGLAIDDVVFSATAATTGAPEPASLATAAVAVTLLGRRRRRA